MGQPVVHFELWSKNPARVSDFYAATFGWDIKFLEEMNYRLVETGGEGGINGGIMEPKDGPWPGNICLYINVDDLAKYLTKVNEAGGKTIVEKMEVPNVGEFALFEDPDGRVLGLWRQTG